MSVPLMERTGSDLPSRRSCPWSAPFFVVAGLLVLAAESAYAVEVYAESGMRCGGLIQRAEVELTADGRYCEPWYDRRERLVTGLLAAAAALLAVGVVRAVSARGRCEPPTVERQVETKNVVNLGVFFPLLYGAPLLVAHLLAVAFAGHGQGLTSVGVPTAWAHISLASGVVVFFLASHLAMLSRRFALAAAGIAIPCVLTAGVFARQLDPHTNDQARAPQGWAWLFGVAFVVLAVAWAWWQQRRGREGPSEALSSFCILGSVAVTTVVLMPQLLPAHREAQGGGPYPFDGLAPELWVPMQSASLLLALLLLAWTAFQPTRENSR